LHDAKEIICLENPRIEAKLSTAIKKEMERFRAVLGIPLFFQRELIGILFLGKKKSDQEFSQDEMDYFPTVATQSALALRNARMHDILMKSQIDFAQQAKMAAIGTLAAGIGHEIKNPLNNIRGAIGMLKLNKKHHLFDGKMLDVVVGEIFEALDVVEKNVDRASQVIDRLQSFAKKPKELRTEKMNVEAALDSALAFVSNQFEMQQIKIVKDYQAGEVEVVADRGAIEDAMLNLITNAAHAMKGQGKLSLRTFCVNDEVHAEIRDTGAGISPENLDKVFDPFFTTKDTTRNSDAKSIKGTGLGLFIVREIMKRFSGCITVESELGKGTSFHISFPIAAGATDAA
jgi:signal transduction histidine kinase